MRPSIFRSLAPSSHQYIRSLSRQSLSFRSIQNWPQKTPQLRQKKRIPDEPRIFVRSSYSSYAVIFLVACSGAIVYEYFVSGTSIERYPEPVLETIVEEFPTVEDERTPAYSKMPTPEGTVGNLTPQQEAKLRDFWALVLKNLGVVDPNGTRPETAGAATAAASTEPETPDKKKKKRISLFSRGKDDGPSSPASNTADEDDKYGQTAELQQILRNVPAETLHQIFWENIKSEHPDALLLRFLRARKWDLDKGLAMLVSTLHWRCKQMAVDDDIMYQGEGGALADSKSSNASTKREGADFLAQLRMGKSFLHGTDKEGRPITYVRARLHRGGEQSEKSMERYTVQVIETARLMLKPPVETGCIVFDMTSFTLQNMDYTPVKFMIKVFEANYPESLGAVLVHKAPWIFQGIWKIIRGWLDPVVAAKVHFTNSVHDMEAFIPRNQIIKELEGDEDWEYKYVEVVEGENDAMKDTATKEQLRAERSREFREYQNLTFKWVAAASANTPSSTEEIDKIKEERNRVASKLNENYWQLDPYIRARSLYDRVGMIEKGGKINFYAKHTLKAENVNGSGGISGPTATATQNSTTSATNPTTDDDVD